MGATPRWMGYVGVKDVDATADRLKRLGGAVYVPPTDSNIGRISVVADPQTATLALGHRAEVTGQRQPLEAGKPGAWAGTSCSPPTGRRRLLSTASFLAGRKRMPKSAPTDALSVVLRRRADDRRHVHQAARSTRFRSGFSTSMSSDIDAAVERVKAAGGEVFRGPARIAGRQSGSPDAGIPQGAAFALQGRRSQDRQVRLVHRVGRVFVERQIGGQQAAAARSTPMPETSASHLQADQAGFGCRCRLGSGLSCRFDQEM